MDNSDSLGLPDWLANPVLISANLGARKSKSLPKKYLSKHIRSRLEALGITYMFPVQHVVIPLMASESARDLCVSAPTGSGKTIAYTIPVVDALRTRIIPRIRALVIVPTRELAGQVKKTFEAFVKGTSLRVGVVTGQTSFSAEQASLVSYRPNDAFTQGAIASSKIDILVYIPVRRE